MRGEGQLVVFMDMALGVMFEAVRSFREGPDVVGGVGVAIV